MLRMQGLGLRVTAKLALGLMLGVATCAQAATIAWDTRNIDGDLDVLTTGSLVRAYNVGNTGVPSTTIHGVTFNPFPVPDGSAFATQGSDTIASVFIIFGGPTTTATDFGSANSPYSDLSADYQTLLGTGAATLNSFLDLELGGLTVGQAYVIQLWTNDSQPAHGGSPFELDTTALLDPNTLGADGGRGQYAIGTFTADSVFQPIGMGFGPDIDTPVLNGYQLRTAAVPEPTSLCLLAVGALGLLARRLGRK